MNLTSIQLLIDEASGKNPGLIKANVAGHSQIAERYKEIKLAHGSDILIGRIFMLVLWHTQRCTDTYSSLQFIIIKYLFF